MSLGKIAGITAGIVVPVGGTTIYYASSSYNHETRNERTIDKDTSNMTFEEISIPQDDSAFGKDSWFSEDGVNPKIPDQLLDPKKHIGNDH